MTLVIVRLGDCQLIAEPVRLADTFIARLRGLLGRDRLEPREGLLISPCRDVHTCGMRFSIDIVFLDRELKVIRLQSASRAWRFYSGGREARYVLELAAGAIAGVGLRVGDTLELNGGPDHV